MILHRQETLAPVLVITVRPTPEVYRSKNKNPVRLQRTGPCFHRRDEKIRTSDLQHPMLASWPFAFSKNRLNSL